MCAMDIMATAEPGSSKAAGNPVVTTSSPLPPCFLCERDGADCDEGLLDCRKVGQTGYGLVNGEGREERDQMLQKVFNVKVI